MKKSQFKSVLADVDAKENVEDTMAIEATRTKDTTPEAHTVQDVDSKVLTDQAEETTVSAVSTEVKTDASTSRTTAKRTSTKDANVANRTNWAKSSEENLSTSARNQGIMLRVDAKSSNQRRKITPVETSTSEANWILVVANRKKARMRDKV